MKKNSPKTLEVLLVEDNPGDVRLTQEALEQARRPHRLNVVQDGMEALEFLRKEGAFHGMPTPDIILLDLNLPRRSGRDVLMEMRKDRALAKIPVVVLTVSRSDRDMVECGKLKANFINKPVTADELAHVMGAPGDFFATAVKPAARSGKKRAPKHAAAGGFAAGRKRSP